MTSARSRSAGLGGQHTAKVEHITRARHVLQLLGDKTKIAESAEHIITFPGGAIEVARTEDGLYWAHIIINRDRIQRGRDLCEIPDAEHATQIAVLIRPTLPQGKMIRGEPAAPSSGAPQPTSDQR